MLELSLIETMKTEEEIFNKAFKEVLCPEKATQIMMETQNFACQTRTI
jgi:hypothetical protein